MKHYKATPEGIAESAHDAAKLSRASDVPVYVYLLSDVKRVRLCRVLRDDVKRRGGYFKYSRGVGMWHRRAFTTEPSAG